MHLVALGTRVINEFAGFDDRLQAFQKTLKVVFVKHSANSAFFDRSS